MQVASIVDNAMGLSGKLCKCGVRMMRLENEEYGKCWFCVREGKEGETVEKNRIECPFSGSRKFRLLILAMAGCNEFENPFRIDAYQKLADENVRLRNELERLKNLLASHYVSLLPEHIRLREENGSAIGFLEGYTEENLALRELAFKQTLGLDRKITKGESKIDPVAGLSGGGVGGG